MSALVRVWGPRLRRNGKGVLNEGRPESKENRNLTAKEQVTIKIKIHSEMVSKPKQARLQHTLKRWYPE